MNNKKKTIMMIMIKKKTPFSYHGIRILSSNININADITWSKIL
jgi:hypothetical protein